jgi:hypothetical protein
MYRQLNEEINTTPVTVNAILCLSCLSTLMLIIIFVAFLASLSDLGALMTDGTKTLQDLQRLLPDAEQSLAIMKNICKNDPKLC